MDKLQTFVPPALDRALARRGEVATATSFVGAALFADITDYTDFAERLCQQGSEGIERLGLFLDRAFRRYVACVHETGGEVACFAGDALLAYWRAESDDTARALASAENCARLLHNASLVDAPEESTARTLHIGIGAGRLWAARLGGIDNRWHLVLAGAAVRAASEASQRAHPGETLSSGGPASGDLKRISDGALEARRDNSRAELDDVVPSAATPWTGDGSPDRLPQLRSICALMLRIDGPNEGDPDALNQYQTAVAAAMTAIQPYTGSSGTLVFEDKGLILKLCLGLPHDSHVDDALRAVGAGLAIEREFHRLGLRCAGGIAAGRGVCTPVGNRQRLHYVAVGRFMHVAARLMQHAGEGLLCTDEVANRVRGEYTLSPEGRVELKGVRGVLRPFRVRDIPRRVERTERLFGREFEQKQLDSHLAAVAKGKGRILWLMGEAGIGKSALVRYFQKVAQERGQTCLLGGAPSVDTAVPYLAWRGVFGALLTRAVPGSSAGDARLANLRHPQLAPLVNAVLPGFMEETEFVKGLSGDARADATSRVLSEALGLCAPRPLVIVLEDCHWMDSASWRLLLRVAQDHQNALLVLTSRPTIQSRELETLRSLEGFLELPVTPLRKDAVAQLVEDLLETETASTDLIDDIVDRSACNPLFIREYTLLLESTTRVTQNGVPLPSSRAAVARDEDLPATVEGLIASRLDSLSPEEYVVLKTASVLGDQFRADVLNGMCSSEAGAPDLGTMLAGLVRRELLVDVGTDSRSFAFRHSLIRQGAYAQLTTTQRKALHRAAAEVLEQKVGGDATRHVATLAHHWLNAEVPERAVVYADRAASQALVAGAYLEADRLLSDCVQLETQAGRKLVDAVTAIRWLRQIAEARRGTGQLESRAAAARQALARAHRWRPKTRAWLTVQAAARALKLILRHTLPGLQTYSHTPLTIEIAQAYRHSAEVCYFDNDMIGMICDSISSVDCAAEAPPSAVLASASTELGGVLAIAGYRWIGERILRRAIEVAATAGDKGALAYAHLVSALYAVGTGDWAGADRSARFCQELCEPMDDAVNWTNAQAIRFWIAHYQGWVEPACEAAQRLQDRARETGNRQHQAWSLRYLAQCDLRRNQPAEAAERLVGALDCLGETAALNERIPAIALLALAKLRSGETWAARAKAGDGLALIAQVKRPIGHGALEGYSALTEVVFDAWRTDAAASNWNREAKRCLRVLRKYRDAFPVGEARYLLCQGDYYTLAGRLSAARASYRKGEIAAQRLGMAWESERCVNALAETERAAAKL